MSPHEKLSDDPWIPARAAQPEPKPREPTVWTRGNFHSVQVNVDPYGANIPGDAANEPSIAIDPTDPRKIVIGWRQFDSVASDFRQAGWAYSHDGGQTWTFPGVLDPGVFGSDPVLAADADGNFYYFSLTGGFSCELFKSTDGGVSWGAGVPAFGGDKPWMTVDQTSGIGSGNVYAGWGSNFIRSTDGGITFTPMFGAVPGVATISVGPDGEVYVCSWIATIARSSDAQDASVTPSFEVFTTASLGGHVGLFGGPNPGGLLGQPWIECHHSTRSSRGNVYLLASVDPPGSDRLDVMFARSTDRGATWSAPVRINDDPPASYAWQWFGTMSVAPNGRIDVIWNDTRDDSSVTHSQLYYSNSHDTGLTWSPNTPVSLPFNHYLGYAHGQGKIGDYYDMVSTDAAAYVAYAATFNGEQDVYFLRIIVDCNSNGAPDSDDIAVGTSQDCTSNGTPDECEPDCNGTRAADSCDIASGVSGDCTSNGVPDECEPDCNTNAAADLCDVAGGSLDCNSNGTPDECELAFYDCNENNTPDDCDILAGTSSDCRLDRVPDECQLAGNDCNTNGIPDDCEAAQTFDPDAFPSGQEISTAYPGVSLSVIRTGAVVHAVASPLASTGLNVFGNSSGAANWVFDGIRVEFAAPVTTVSIDIIADGPGDVGFLFAEAFSCSSVSGTPSAGQALTLTISCPQGFTVVEAGADAGSILLDHLVFDSSSTDCDDNGVPDACDDPDCNSNGFGDACDIIHGTTEDCNRNRIPDSCDISSGTSRDSNTNATPDECEAVPVATVSSVFSRKTCDLVLPLSPFVGSEPRVDRLTELRIGFDVAPGGPGPNPVTIDEKVCPPPGTYAPYTGASEIATRVSNSELVLTFTPGLEKARTYRLNLGPEVTSIAGQFVEVRVLVGDVNGDGRVNGSDRSVVVGVWTGTGFHCATDVIGDGLTNRFDRDVVVQAWRSNSRCAP